MLLVAAAAAASGLIGFFSAAGDGNRVRGTHSTLDGFIAGDVC